MVHWSNITCVASQCPQVQSLFGKCTNDEFKQFIIYGLGGWMDG